MTDEMKILQNKHQKKLKERKSKIRYFYTSKFIKPLNDEFEYKVSWGVDLQTEHERYLSEKIFGKPVFVTYTLLKS